MHCRSCDYPLWQIKDRKCPECGAPFRPREFEFRLNSVRFCCPHCDQAYYGTGAKGWLVPEMFVCVGCLKTIDMDEMVLLPTAGVREDQTQTLRQPWLERGKRRGYVAAWFATIGHAMMRPGDLLRATPVSGGKADATRFMLSVNLLVGGLCAASGLLVSGLFTAAFAGPRSMSVWAQNAIWCVAVLLFFVVAAVLVAGVAHGILRLTGATAHGFARTWQAICYSSGANLLSGVCGGVYIGWVWWAVSACIAVKAAQRVSGPRAALAVLTTPVIFLLLATVGYGWLIYRATSAPLTVGSAPVVRSTPSGPYVSSSPDNQTRMRTIARAWRDEPNEVRHVAEMLRDRVITQYELMDHTDASNGGVLARMERTPIGNTTLREFPRMMTAAEQATEAKNAADGLPANVIAYRVGDTVLTHPGIDRSLITTASSAQQLWVAIGWPQSLVSSNTTTIVVALADGTIEEFSSAAIALELAKQNKIRAEWGLPGLPVPANVSHEAPDVTSSPVKMTIPKKDAGSGP